MDVSSDVTIINGTGITSTISIDRVKLVPTKCHVTKKKTCTLYPPAKITVPKIEKSGCGEPLEYADEKVVNRRHMSRNLLYKVRFYR